MATTKNTAVSKARVSRFVAVDERIMTSGHLSDVEVKCDTRTWRLHRLILTTRCVWFDKALNSEFKEGTTGLVEIHDFEPGKIDQLIKYIYTGTLPMKGGIHSGCFRDSIDMYELGDYFLLPELCEDCLDRLKETFDQAAHVFQQQLIPRAPHIYGGFNNYYQDEYVDDKGIQAQDSPQITTLSEGFYDAVMRVYMHESLSEAVPLREVIMSFYSKVDLFLLGYQKQGMETLLLTPQFAAEVLVRGNGVGIRIPNAKLPSSSCSKCGKNPFSNDTSGHFAKICFKPVNNGNYKLSAYCQACIDGDPSL